MTKSSAELTQKAAGYMLAAANACKREMNEKLKTTTPKATSPKATSPKATKSKETKSKETKSKK